MDPFTFGIVFVGATGVTLIGLALLEEAGAGINTGMIRLFMTVAKYGGILLLLNHMWDKFF